MMKKLLFILSFSLVVFSCKKEIEPAPENTAFFESLKNTAYGENASVSIELKAFPYKHATDVTVDWGDGTTESSKFAPEQNFANLVLTFSHKYAQNGTYKVTFKAVNAVTANSIDTELKIANKEPQPVADFAYEILENGKVRFKNLSPASNATYYWGDTKTQNRSLLANPEFIYERNGNYSVFLTVTDQFNQFTTVHKTVNVTNAVPKDFAFFKGTIFNEPIEFSENDNNVRTVLSEAEPLSTRITNSISLNSSNEKIELGLSGMFFVKGSGNPEFSVTERFDKFREYLTPGVKKVGVQMHDQWNITVKYETPQGNVVKQFTDIPNAVVEIAELKEIDQPALFDGLYRQSFWVTFKLKADFQGLGKIDGTVKIRYLVYKMI